MVNIKIITPECTKMCHFALKTFIYSVGEHPLPTPLTNPHGAYGALIQMPSVFDLGASVTHSYSRRVSDTPSEILCGVM